MARVHHKDKSSAIDNFVEEVKKVLESHDKFMVAVWGVKDGRVKLAHRTTYEFPVGDFLSAVGTLALNCFEETIGQEEPEEKVKPLPLAEKFKGLVNLRGEHEKN